NGGQVLELNAATTASIISEGYVETPVYSNGNGPINVKVVDPLNVVDGYFECLFTDYNTTPTNSADTADWVINRYDKEGGSLLESVSSSRSIAINNEQIIPEWGVSVQINQNNYYLPEGASGDAKERTTDFLSGTITYGDSSKRWLSAVPDGDGFNAFNWIRSGDYDPTNGTATVDDDDCTDATDPEYLAYTDPCNYPDVLNQDTDKNWASILEGGIAPHKLVGYESSYMPIAYDNYAGVGVARKLSSLSWLPSVDIVFTSDKSKWTRCPVIELGRESSLNVGGAAPGELRASPSVDKNGNSDGTGTGMGWFPGYAIDVESGARLYMAFGENSFLVSNNGADMLWNPTEDMMDNNGTPILGGMHAFYVFSFQNKAKNNFLQAQNYPAYIPSQAENNATNELYNDFQNIAANQTSAKKKVYSSISWVANPVLAASQELLSTDATIRLRVNKEYKNFSNPTNNTGGPNGGKPMYSWSTSDIATELGSADELTSALDLINVVPNPYYAYSQYERNRLDTRVKITNLPERCTV
ncbi:MAG: T9SS C-terminal target domain-containing protein, partial [Crocinitomicaceae bacterium]|nr:T9SS C-terminal target domain-containing protein [Crocinitomicaceae bacterium]